MTRRVSTDGPIVTIGLMSGTSMDGVDALALRDDGGPGQVLGHLHRPFGDPLRAELLALNSPGPDELHRAALAANALSRAYAEATLALCQAAGLPAQRVAALGAHGQTVRHRPGEFDGCGYTLQLLNGALLAELTGIDVVCDLRSRDVAAGGQGAPLVPAFHHAAFARSDQDLAVLNLGGIANLTLLPQAGTGPVRGFDCGPGNALLDHWVGVHRGLAFDADGAWAESGRVDAALLQALLADPFFARQPPKSTGRDLFNPAWLQARAGAALQRLSPVDVQATLAELTARGAADAVQAHQPQTAALLVCGGGAANGSLMRRLERLLPQQRVGSTHDAGLPPMQVEAAAFAWLARAFVQGQAGNRPEVTGARGERPLGALYPAGLRPRG